MEKSVINLLVLGNKYTLHSLVINLSVTEESYNACYRKFSNLVNKALLQYEKENGRLTDDMKKLLAEIEELKENNYKEVDGITYVVEQGIWIAIDNKGFEPVK